MKYKYSRKEIADSLQNWQAGIGCMPPSIVFHMLAKDLLAKSDKGKKEDK